MNNSLMHKLNLEFEIRGMSLHFYVYFQKFQEIEESHLKQMKEFLSTYIELLQNNHDMVGQVSWICSLFTLL